MTQRQYTLYSAKTEIDRNSIEWVRISKFVDGELESSYLTSHTECNCPAGVRPSCRHRQMLPQMQAHRIINTHWFWNFDLNRVVDFNGQLKSNLDALNELAEQRTQEPVTEQPQLSGLQEEQILMGFHQPELCKPERAAPPSSGQGATKPSWRRI